MPEPLDDSELAAWGALATLLERLGPALDAQLMHDDGITHFEHGILYALDSSPERALRLSTLAGYASSTLSRMSRAVTRLEKAGWVRRDMDPDDGRAVRAVLTDDGAALLRRSTPAHHALVRRLVLDPLTDQQVAQLATIARTINASIDPRAPWTPPRSTM